MFVSQVIFSQNKRKEKLALQITNTEKLTLEIKNKERLALQIKKTMC
jgi:hypothetical protein